MLFHAAEPVPEERKLPVQAEARSTQSIQWQEMYNRQLGRSQSQMLQERVQLTV